MYESDWLDEMYMDYRANHPFDKEDRKFMLKVIFGVVALFVFTYAQDVGFGTVKGKTLDAKEIQSNQSGRIDSVDTIKLKSFENIQKTR